MPRPDFASILKKQKSGAIQVPKERKFTTAAEGGRQKKEQPSRRRRAEEAAWRQKDMTVRRSLLSRKD
jgi:hypothetical protein